MLDGVGERLLGHTEHCQLNVRRRTRLVGSLELDRAAGQRLDALDEPLEGGAGTEVVEDRQPQVADDARSLVATSRASFAASVWPDSSRVRTSIVSC